MKIAVFDTETTGFLMPKASPLEKQPYTIEFGAVVVVDGAIEKTVNFLIKPGIPIPAGASKVNGIFDKDVENQPAFKDFLQEIRDIFDGATIAVAHNAPFDTGILKNDIQRCGCEDFPWPKNIICSVQEYRHLFGKRPKLTELYQRFVGKELAQTHRALDDAMALYEALEKDNFFKTMEEAYAN